MGVLQSNNPENCDGCEDYYFLIRGEGDLGSVLLEIRYEPVNDKGVYRVQRSCMYGGF